MTGDDVFNIEFFNTNILSIYPTTDSLKGIFAYLRFLDGNYFSRYHLEGDIALGNIEDLVKAFESQHYYIRTSDEKPQITFSFDDYFIATNYTMTSPNEPNHDHSFIKSWHLIGVSEDQKEHIIDSRSDDLCGKISCKNLYTKTYPIKKPAAYKKYILKSIENSANNPYLLIRFFDLFGSICSNNETKCYFPQYKRTCSNNRTPIYISLFVYVIIFS